MGISRSMTVPRETGGGSTQCHSSSPNWASSPGTQITNLLIHHQALQKRLEAGRETLAPALEGRAGSGVVLNPSGQAACQDRQLVRTNISCFPAHISLLRTHETSPPHTHTPLPFWWGFVVLCSEWCHFKSAFLTGRGSEGHSSIMTPIMHQHIVPNSKSKQILWEVPDRNLCTSLGVSLPISGTFAQLSVWGKKKKIYIWYEV